LQPTRFGTKLPQTTRFNPLRKRYQPPDRIFRRPRLAPNLPGLDPSLVTINHTENKGKARPYAGAGRGPFPNSISSALQNLTAARTDGATCYVETLAQPPTR
jgi:hypothetical protein